MQTASGWILPSALKPFANHAEGYRHVLGSSEKAYQIVQNWDAFSFFDSIVGGDGIQYETAGALGNGERILYHRQAPGLYQGGTGKIPDEQYVFLTTSHDGLGSITPALTPVRIVCAIP